MMPNLKGVNAGSKQWRVIIVGGGFGGLRSALALKSAPVEVTLIDRRNYHPFQPLLYQVATGSLSPGEIAAPLRSVLSRQKNTRVLLGEVVDLDPGGKRVLLADGASFEYDSLIVAAGSQTSYYGHDAWRTWAPARRVWKRRPTSDTRFFTHSRSPNVFLIPLSGAHGSGSSS
jgi:NADH dehydrogenase